MGKALVKQFFSSIAWAGRLKSQHMQRIWTSSPILDFRVPVVCTFSPADVRVSEVPLARKVTGYILLCCNLRGMYDDRMAPCDTVLQFRHDADKQ